MSKALAAYRKARAVELALAGHDYDSIVKELGYAHRASAWKAVQRALGERKDWAVDQYRREQVGLLNELMSARWESRRPADLVVLQRQRDDLYDRVVAALASVS